MLYVKTKIAPSKIAGIGLFAAEDIPKGALIWKLKPGFDIVMDKVKLKELSDSAKQQVLNYCYVNPKSKKIIICSDDARFINHSKTPSALDVPTKDGLETEVFAAHNIKKGEEITEDYEIFDEHYRLKLNIS